MKKSLFACAFLGMLCQSSFAACPHVATSPLFAVGVPEVGSTLALLAIGVAGLAAIARKRK